ncbi:MAG: hypothetical protein WAV26_11705 [Candidatus Deferrimicrobium sp.]
MQTTISTNEYASELSAPPERIVVPTVVLHEVYKFLLSGKAPNWCPRTPT